MSQTAAARALGCSRGTVLARVAAGDLRAERIDETTLVIERASVEQYLARQTAVA